ncbi:hypothetical protein E1A91_D12G011000v1 [Gossypium mustelinum]|uniref:Desiccation-related protein PCC13-62-like n=1 Tax=Gossypium mustelinum TaxID=34275 RepID=A0A5D2S8Z4_GOSMU|nr:hypothetical protein E1A91_D12G011000v1 [Gossypium mustelinum]
MANRSCLSYAFLLLVAFQSSMIMANTVIHTPQCRPVAASSKDKILFSMNLLIYKAEFFLRASVGVGINGISPGLVQGPVPIGATLANITNSARRVIEELGLATVGHLRAIKQVLRSNLPFPGPQLDLSAQVFAGFVNLGFNVSTLSPPFNIYANTLSFVLAAEAISAFIVQYYAGIIPSIVGDEQRQLVAGIGLNEAAAFGVLRTILNDGVNSTVLPYTFTMAELTNRTSEVVNRLGGCGVKDEGLIVPFQLGAENRSTSNVVPGDVNSLAHARFEREILRIVFGTGNATMPGGLFPDGFIGALYQLIINLKLS